jgi:hypothetical protein
MGFLQLFTGSNRGAPVTDDNPIPVKLPPGSIPAPPAPEGAATEAKQDAIIAAIEGISVPAPEGGATEATLQQVSEGVGEVKLALDAANEKLGSSDEKLAELVQAAEDTAPIPTRPYGDLASLVDGNNSATGTGNTSLIAAGGTGVSHYLTEVTVYNSSDTDSAVILKSGTTERRRIPAPAKMGAIVTFPAPLKPGAANEAWQFAAETGVSTLYVGASGFAVTAS